MGCPTQVIHEEIVSQVKKEKNTMESQERTSNTFISQAQWIWLNEERFPQFQMCRRTASGNEQKDTFCVVELKKEFVLDRQAVAAQITLCADTKYLLFVNGHYVGQGPVSPGGDFESADVVPYIYTSSFSANLKKGKNVISALVQMSYSVLTEVSWGHGGFLAACDVVFEDGSSQAILSDSSWDIRIDPHFLSDDKYDQSQKELDWEKASPVKKVIWQVRPSEIPNLHEEFIRPCDYFVYDEYRHLIDIEENRVRVKAGVPVTFIAKFDKIYSGYASFRAAGQKGVVISLKCQELIGRDNSCPCKTIVLDGKTDYRCMRMDSIGYMQITVSNMMEEDVFLEDIGLHFICYPVLQEGHFHCNDSVLNKIYEVGKWTLQICRQSIHLDSPTHQEPLACTGDYYIESLMNYFTFGDPRLTRFDIVRTAHILRINDGRMFHTTYSLILIQMAMDYYRFTGDISLFREVIDAFHLLMRRFHSYMGDSGVLENAPNYMFVDWVEVDGFNMHHPPKALGQSCLNAFYYQALLEMKEICRILGDNKMSVLYSERAENLKEAFHRCFWVEEKGLYCDGMNTPQKGGRWLPDNTEKQYFSQHTNTLAALYHLCPKEMEEKLMVRVLEDKELTQAQPYFMHFVLDAIYSTNLFEKYGLSQIRRWKKLTDECDRGMKECWYGFDCDFSHAWGATPTYQLPARLLGFEMIEPGFKKIKLSPNLYDLDYADISMPTPYGMIKVSMKKGQEPVLSIPEEIELCG